MAIGNGYKYIQLSELYALMMIDLMISRMSVAFKASNKPNSKLRYLSCSLFIDVCIMPSKILYVHTVDKNKLPLLYVTQLRK